MGMAKLEGQDYNFAIHQEIMPQIAKQLKLDVLPMKDPNFNFFAAAFVAVKRMTSLGGGDPYDAARDVMRMILTPTSKGPAPIYRYASWYQKQKDEGETPQTFDAFFQMVVYQKRNTVLKNFGKRKKQRGLSIDYGREESEGSIGEELISDTGPSPEDIYAEQEERERRQKAFSDVPSHLMTDQRHGHRYVAMWNLMKADYKMPLWKLADELNKEGITSPSGGQWGTGSVDKVRTRILTIVKHFLKDKGIDWESISASRRGFRFGLV
jgi:transposase